MNYDFIQLLNDYGIPYKQEVDNWIQIHCPICKHEGSRGFKGGLNIAGGYFNCWACGSSPIEKVFSELLNVTIYKAKEILSQYSSQDVIRNKLNKKIIKNINIELPGEKIEEKSLGYSYLIKRNFSPNTIIDSYKICWGGIIGEWSFRIIIPIFYNKRLVSYQGRSIYSKNKCLELGILRYITLSKEKSIIDPKSICYNLDNCFQDWVVLVEGVFDCWRLGPKNICASLGTSMSEEQIVLLANRFKKVIILFDNEREAQERAKKYGQRLAGLGIDVEIFNPEFEHDPGDYSIEEEVEVRKELGLLNV